MILDEKFKLKEKLMLTLSENKTEQINCISISFNDESNEEFVPKIKHLKYKVNINYLIFLRYGLVMLLMVSFVFGV